MFQEIPDREIITYNSLVIDHNTYAIKYDGVKYNIPEKEFMTLSLFASKPGRIFTRTEILDTIWKRDANLRTVDATILKLRKRFGEEFIKTSLCKGYGLNEEVVK